MSGPQIRRTPGADRGFEKATACGGHDFTALRALYGTSPEVEFADEARRHGLAIEGTAIGDGAVHRVYVEGDKRGTRNGWYVLHLDGVPAGAFSSWKTGVVETWRAGGRERLTPQERHRLNAAVAEAKRLREAQKLERWEAVRDEATARWQAAAAPDLRHPYLMAKAVGAYGIRQADSYLLVPMRDGEGELWSLQTIAPDGSKRYLRGARKVSLYHAIGGPVTDRLCVAEGYATAVSVHVATGQPVAVAFDCGNLAPVGRVLRGKYPSARITFCADNDHETPGNPGVTKATAAANEVGGRVAIPPDGFNDFNDAARGGNP
jgi:putative DNA primase/helicase